MHVTLFNVVFILNDICMRRVTYNRTDSCHLIISDVHTVPLGITPKMAGLLQPCKCVPDHKIRVNTKVVINNMYVNTT